MYKTHLQGYILILNLNVRYHSHLSTGICTHIHCLLQKPTSQYVQLAPNPSYVLKDKAPISSLAYAIFLLLLLDHLIGIHNMLLSPPLKKNNKTFS